MESFHSCRHGESNPCQTGGGPVAVRAPDLQVEPPNTTVYFDVSRLKRQRIVADILHLACTKC
jgi:hypothetical protein